MSEYPKSEFKPAVFNSEIINPTAAYALGIWFHNCELARELKDKIEKRCKDESRNETFQEMLDCDRFFHQCSHMWWGLQALNTLSIVTNGAVHFSLAISNEMRKVSKYIKEHLGFCPILDKDKCKELMFGDNSKM